MGIAARYLRRARKNLFPMVLAGKCWAVLERHQLKLLRRNASQLNSDPMVQRYEGTFQPKGVIVSG